MVSSRFDSHSKEEASTLEAAGEEGKRVGRTKGQDLQYLQAHGTTTGGVENQDDTSGRGGQTASRGGTG
jgi:hypothetical protein